MAEGKKGRGDWTIDSFSEFARGIFVDPFVAAKKSVTVEKLTNTIEGPLESYIAKPAAEVTKGVPKDFGEATADFLNNQSK